MFAPPAVRCQAKAASIPTNVLIAQGSRLAAPLLAEAAVEPAQTPQGRAAWQFRTTPIFPSGPANRPSAGIPPAAAATELQAITRADDPREAEADRLAGEIMNMRE